MYDPGYYRRRFPVSASGYSGHSEKIQITPVSGGFLIGGFKMDACKHIYFYTPGQLILYAAGIIATAAAMLAAAILC
jgi:hypothetical protein